MLEIQIENLKTIDIGQTLSMVKLQYCGLLVELLKYVRSLSENLQYNKKQ